MADSEIVSCPYDPLHRMLRRRLAPHLLKCKKNHPNIILKECFFDRTHLVPVAEFEFHVTNCPGRKIISDYKHNAPIKNESPIRQNPIDSDENWDDTDVVDYNPRNYIENSKVLRIPVGHQPSQRRAFINQELKRLSDIKDETTDEIKCEENEQPSKDEMPEAPPPPTWISCLNSIRSKSSSPTTENYSHSRSRSRSRSPINRNNSSREGEKADKAKLGGNRHYNQYGYKKNKPTHFCARYKYEDS